MPLGFAILLCALVLSLFGAASPIIRPLRISGWVIALILAGMFGLGLLGMIVITEDFAFQPALLAPIGFAVVLMVRMNWMRQRFIALACALAAGFVGYAAQRLLENTRFLEPGLPVGVAIALTSVLLGQYRRVRLFAGSVGVVFTALCGLAADLLTGGYGLLRLGEGAQFDAAVTALVFTLLFTGIAMLLRRRSLGLEEETPPPRMRFMAKRKP